MPISFVAGLDPLHEGTIYICRPRAKRRTGLDLPIRAPLLDMGEQYRTRSDGIRHPLTAEDQCSTCLSEDRQFRAFQLLLDHPKIESTVKYPGIEVDDAIEVAGRIEI